MIEWLKPKENWRGSQGTFASSWLPQIFGIEREFIGLKVDCEFVRIGYLGVESAIWKLYKLGSKMQQRLFEELLQVK